MNQSYVDTVRLLLSVAPTVFQSSRFAMKGGTALNLFVQDMPRLSVDIDVVFADYTLDRSAALQVIADDLKVARTALSKMGHRVVMPTTSSGDEVKLLVDGADASVKIEVNFVFRGTVLPAVQSPLVSAAQELFTTDSVRQRALKTIGEVRKRQFFAWVTPRVTEIFRIRKIQ